MSPVWAARTQETINFASIQICTRKFKYKTKGGRQGEEQMHAPLPEYRTLKFWGAGNIGFQLINIIISSGTVLVVVQKYIQNTHEKNKQGHQATCCRRYTH